VRDIVDDPDLGGRVSVSLPSLRVDAFTVGTAAEIQKVRRTGLTFAPEGGTWRMRRVINKLITEEDLYGAVDAAFSQGWRRVKLYFLIGLPTERDEDVLGIAELGARCVEIGRRSHKSVTVVASVGGFVPKAHTPFQWFGQDTAPELERKVALLRAEAKNSSGLDAFLKAAMAAGRPLHDSSLKILGPASALIARRADHYRAHLLVETQARSTLQRFLANWLPRIETLAGPPGLRWSIDVDPLEVD